MFTQNSYLEFIFKVTTRGVSKWKKNNKNSEENVKIKALEMALLVGLLEEPLQSQVELELWRLQIL